jgi:hypothetical protein
MTKQKEISDNLFELFAGEYVSMLLEATMENVNQNGDQVEIVKAPLSVVGFLSDEDNVYFYLGHEPSVYNQAVRKDRVVHIEVLEEPMEEKKEIFKDVKGPDGKGYN